MAIRRRATDPQPIRPAHGAVRWARPLVPGLLVALALVGPAACGSDDEEPEPGNRQQQVEDPADVGATTSSFCDAVAEVAEAEAIGDTLAMATALELVLDDLPQEVAEEVQAYVDGLEAAPANRVPAPDSIENTDAEAAYRSYAEETCGAGATDAGDGSSSSSTTTTPDARTPTSDQPGAGDNGQQTG